MVLRYGATGRSTLHVVFGPSPPCSESLLRATNTTGFYILASIAKRRWFRSSDVSFSDRGTKSTVGYWVQNSVKIPKPHDCRSRSTGRALGKYQHQTTCTGIQLPSEKIKKHFKGFKINNCHTTVGNTNNDKHYLPLSFAKFYSLSIYALSFQPYV